jgi:phage tail-like protein
LYALIGVMSDLHAPSEDALDRVEQFFNPYLAPDAFLPFLARWVSLEWLLGDTPAPSAQVADDEFPGGANGLRKLVANGADLAHWRGTERGMQAFLALATGRDGFAIGPAVDDAGAPIPFRLALRAPDGPEAYRTLVERIIRHEKPAHLEVDVHFVSE